MSATPRPIFRSHEAARSAALRTATHAPRGFSRTTIVGAWIAIVLLFCAGLCAWNAPVPVYVDGSSVWIEQSADGLRSNEPAAQPRLLAVFPPAALGQLEVGQELFVASQPAARFTIESIDERALTLDEIVQRHHPRAALIGHLDGRMCVVLARAERAGELVLGPAREIIVPLRARLGRQSALSTLPVVGPWFMKVAREHVDARVEPDRR